MDLILKVGVLIVVLVVIFSVAWALSSHASSTKVTQSQAEQLVLNDVKQSNPNATVTVVSVTNSTLEANSWQVILSVTYNGTRPCPTLLIEGFDYPATGLVPSTDNLYTKGCVIYGLSNAPSYVISSPEIAIVRSYTANSTTIMHYVGTYGYNNTVVHAAFYPSLRANATPIGMQFSNVWLVNYSAAGTSYNLLAVLAQSGQIQGTYNSSK